MCRGSGETIGRRSSELGGGIRCPNCFRKGWVEVPKERAKAESRKEDQPTGQESMCIGAGNEKELEDVKRKLGRI